MRQRYRQAVDSGRKSGHGRVVSLYYETCPAIWGGSPATDQLEIGLESIDVNGAPNHQVTHPLLQQMMVAIMWVLMARVLEMIL